MAKAKIIITGEIEKFKVNENRTVNVIIKADTSKGVPNGLKELGASTYSINISRKTWKKVSDKLQGNRIMVNGEPKASVTAKGVPFTIVNCFDISVIEQKVKENQSGLKKTEPSKTVQQPSKKEFQGIKPLDTKSDSPKTQIIRNKSKNDYDTKALYHWRKNHKGDIQQDINVADLVLTEEEHLKGFKTKGFIFFNSFKEYAIQRGIIVRPLGNGKFSLVAGFMSYLVAKALNFDTIPAIVTDFSRQSLIEEACKQFNTEDIAEITTHKETTGGYGINS